MYDRSEGRDRGDTCTRWREREAAPVFAAAADCVARAVVHAVLEADSAGGLDSYLTRFPSASR